MVKYADVRLADEQQVTFRCTTSKRRALTVQESSQMGLNGSALCIIEAYWAAKKGNADELVRLGLSQLELDSSGNAIASGRFPLLGAYDLCLKCSHFFNILDARGAISVTERVGVIARVRALAVGIAKAWVDQQRAELPPEKREIDGNRGCFRGGHG